MKLSSFVPVIGTRFNADLQVAGLSRKHKDEGTASDASIISEHVALSWLSKFLVADHFVLDSNQNLLHGIT